MTLVSSFTITNKNEYSVELTHDDKTVEKLEPGQTSVHLKEIGVYKALAPWATLPEPPPPPIVLLQVHVSRLLGAHDKTFTTTRTNGNFLMALDFAGQIEA